MAKKTKVKTAPTPVVQETPKNPEVTVNNLYNMVKFLENLSNMKRLSDVEVEALRPDFENIVNFLKHYESIHNPSVVESSEEELDL